MKRWGVVFFLIVVLVFAVSAFANHGQKQGPSLESGLIVATEEDCVDNFGNKTCKETTYVSCNGEQYKVPVPTGFTVYRNTVEKEYIEKECGLPNNRELESPQDRIKESDVHVFSDRVILDIKRAKWRVFMDSNSMDPLIDEGTTTIEIKPESEKEIHVGDIIAYNTDEAEYTLVHRVVAIESDENGTYFITKGDNYFRNDPYKVRFSQIEGIVVGVLY